jgi:anti-anti-sigma factor
LLGTYLEETKITNTKLFHCEGKMVDFEKSVQCGFLIRKVNLNHATILEALEFKNIIDKDIEDGNHSIIIDLSNCNFLDSTFIGVLVVTWKKLKAKGGKLKLVKPGNFAKSVFHLTGTIEIFENYDTVEAAVGSFAIPIQKYEPDFKSASK